MRTAFCHFSPLTEQYLKRCSTICPRLIRRSSNSTQPTFEHLISIGEIRTCNQYEAQIFSTLSRWSGKRLESYKIPDSVKLAELHDFSKVFFKKESTSKSQAKKVTKFDLDSTFSCDLYINFDSPSSPVGRTKDFLAGAVTKLHKKTEISEEDDLVGKWIFIEITQGPKFLLQKLWQLERAVRVLPSMGDYRPASLVVLMNGDESEAADAIDLISIPQDAEILKYPLFIGWTPTRNIFTVVSNLSADVSSLKTDVSLLKTDVASLKTDVASLKNDMKEVKDGIRRIVELLPIK
jgi:hypothetical protein